MKIKKSLIALVFACISISANAQYWLLGGNPPAGPFGAAPPVTNYLGGVPGNLNWMHLGSVGSSDIFIDNNAAQLSLGGGGTQVGGHWVGLGRIFGPLIRPQAHLHICGGNNAGTVGAPFGSGLRTWFRTGTLYTENTDAMYVGLKELSIPNSEYAVINWSDAAFGGSGTDYLSFNFTTGGANPTPLARTPDGMEMGRFVCLQTKLHLCLDSVFC